MIGSNCSYGSIKKGVIPERVYLFCDSHLYVLWIYRKILWKNVFKWSRIDSKVFFKEKEKLCSTIMKLKI